MTITEGKTEQGLLNFFGDAEVVQQFKDLTNPEQMIEFMWKSAAFQVYTLRFVNDLSLIN